MSETGRGLVIFLTAIATLGLWAPLNSDAVRNAAGQIVTDTYFGPLHYLVLHTELKEPDYSMTKKWSAGRLGLTAALTAGLWGAVLWKIRQPKRAA